MAGEDAGSIDRGKLRNHADSGIYDDAVGLFFCWLCERDLIGEGFASEFGETDKAKLPEDVKNGKITPLEALAGLGHYFSYEWIRLEAVEFQYGDMLKCRELADEMER